MNSRRVRQLLVLSRLFYGGAAWLALALALPTSPARADEFVMKDGRLIRGTVRRQQTLPDSNDKQFAVEIGPGIIVLINQREIKTHAVTSKPEREYAELMKHNQDSVEFHLAVAAWCHENGLSDHEAAHYQRVLDLAPDNSVARAALKYAKGKDGRWIKRDVLMTEGRGKVNVGGKYRFPEVVALEEAQAAANTARLGLVKDIRGWQVDIITGNRRAVESKAKLETLDGPQASAAVADVLFPKTGPAVRGEPPPEALRMLYVDVLTRLADPVAVQSLIRLAVNDSAPQIREKCLEALRSIAPRAAALGFIQLLSSDNPEEINKAGRALAVMNDPIAILPLIEHVVTKHKRQSGGNGSTNVNFNNQGSYTLGTAKPTYVEVPSQNADVLGALTALTGQAFQYDKDAWYSWYARQYYPSAGDLRRDP